MTDCFLSHIRVYPIKACAGTELQEAHMDECGLRYDRRWMVVHDDGSDIHQLSRSHLACVTSSIEADGLVVQAPGMSALHIPFQPQKSSTVVVRWYEGICEAALVSDEADAWFQDFLHLPCHLVFMPENANRFVDPKYAFSENRTAFTSFPYHLIGEASLDELNRRMETPVPLDRFRPNLVFAGGPAFAEDHWYSIQINGCTFYLVKSCERCAITTIDQVRGEPTGTEPLRTLARFRTINQKVLFGQYMLSAQKGILHVGDAIHVLENKAERPLETQNLP